MHSKFPLKMRPGIISIFRTPGMHRMARMEEIIITGEFVGIGNILDVYLIQNGSAIRTAIIFFYLSNEGISILENTGKIGLPIPEKLKKVLEQLNKEE